MQSTSMSVLHAAQLTTTGRAVGSCKQLHHVKLPIHVCAIYRDFFQLRKLKFSSIRNRNYIFNIFAQNCEYWLEQFTIYVLDQK